MVDTGARRRGRQRKADLLAKAGASMSLVGPEPYCGITKRKWEPKISAWEAKSKASYWNDTPGKRQAKLFIKYSKKRASELVLVVT